MWFLGNAVPDESQIPCLPSLPNVSTLSVILPISSLSFCPFILPHIATFSFLSAHRLPYGFFFFALFFTFHPLPCPIFRLSFLFLTITCPLFLSPVLFFSPPTFFFCKRQPLFLACTVACAYVTSCICH